MSEPNESDRKALQEFREVICYQHGLLRSVAPSDKQLLEFRAQARDEERERCASLVEDGHGNIGRMLAAAIRGPESQVCKVTPERDLVIEECAKLMEGEKGAWEPEFCRTVDHVQGMCECPERAAAIRALKEKRG